MSNVKVITNRSDLVAIADAVRNKTGSTEEMTLGGIADEISEIKTEPNLQDKTVIPTITSKTISADEGYNGLGEVIVNGMRYDYTNKYATSIYASTFTNCKVLKTVNFTKAKTIGNYAFQSCTNLTSVYFSQATTIGTSAFANCSLYYADFPLVSTISKAAFEGNMKLAEIELPCCNTIKAAAFSGCRALELLHLLGSSVCTLENSNAFTGTAIGSNEYDGGVIHVPASLLASYKTATNWTYFSKKFDII